MSDVGLAQEIRDAVDVAVANVRGPRVEFEADMASIERSISEIRGPAQSDVDAVRGLLDLMANFADNDQRARFLLSSNWMRDRGALTPGEVAEPIEAAIAEERQRSSDPSVSPVNIVIAADLDAQIDSAIGLYCYEGACGLARCGTKFGHSDTAFSVNEINRLVAVHAADAHRIPADAGGSAVGGAVSIAAEPPAETGNVDALTAAEAGRVQRTFGCSS